MSELLELAARVEAATGPDRELDAEIWLACVPGATRSELRYTHKATGKDCVIDETRDASRKLIVVPAYTASLDATKAFVGDNHWRVEDHPMAGPCAVVGDQEGYAQTAELAFTAACLRTLSRASAA